MNNWTAEKIFNKERFEAWLANQPGERGFDYTDPEHCALCGFIRETTSAPLFSVSADTFHLNPDYMAEIPLPKWAVDALLEARLANNVLGPVKISHLRTAYQKLFGVDVCAEYPTESTAIAAGKV